MRQSSTAGRTNTNNSTAGITSYFDKLKVKWRVNSRQLMLILWVFALTGTSIALLTRKVTDWLQLEISSVLYWCTKVMMLLIGYPVLLLIVALPFGMLSFFLDVEKKILQWLGLIKKTNTKSNAE